MRAAESPPFGRARKRPDSLSTRKRGSRTTLIDCSQTNKPVNLTHLKSVVTPLDAWKSIVLARVSGANVKVMRMDGTPYPNESHDYPEGLLVVDGQLNLTIGSEAIAVRAGEIYVVPAGVAHAVAPGSTGTLVIFDA